MNKTVMTFFSIHFKMCSAPEKVILSKNKGGNDG
jgi:hypothetical protein